MKKENKIKKFCGILMLTILLFSTCISVSAKASVEPVYRFFNGTDHFYTATYAEGANVGYTYEGIEFKSRMDGGYGWDTPVYRFFNGTDHLYTTTYAEGQNAGYTYEGVEFYSAKFFANVTKRIPVYRFFNGTDHFYTTTYAEGANAGYTYEEIAFYECE